jgi:hypothetical protein
MTARAWLVFVAVLAGVLSFGCEAKRDSAAPTSIAAAEPPPPPGTSPADSDRGKEKSAGGGVADAIPRRVIRTAELSLEADDPDAVRAKAGALAEAAGGFVVTSDTSHTRDADGTEYVMVTIVLRAPSARFDETLGSLRALGTHVASEKVTGQDVTEEYTDLEARLKAERAIEDQYLSVLKDARTIPDVLAVQAKLGEVRTEIERAEGRRRFLENETNLSTFTVHVARRLEAIDTSGPGFGRSMREAGHDAVAVALAIVNGTIRTVGVLAPIGVIFGIPLYLVIRAWRRRRRPSP